MTALPAPALTTIERQFGVIARVQLLDHLTEGQVEGLVSRGTLVSVERGVYRVQGGARVPEQVPMAAALRARPAAKVTGPFVLGALGVEGFTRTDPFEILTAPGRRLTGVDFPHRPDPTPSQRPAHFEGMPIVRPARALVDTGRFVDQVGARRLRIAYDSARWKGLLTTERVRRELRSLGGDDPGVLGFHRAFEGDLIDDRTSESEPERLVGVYTSVFDPPPEPQVWVLPNRRVDWFWRVLRLVLEYFGEVDHAHARARLDDDDRSGELRAAGLVAVPIVAADLRDRGGFVAWMRAVTSARAYELGVPAPRLLAS